MAILDMHMQLEEVDTFDTIDARFG